MTADPAEVERLLRELAPQALGAVIRRFRDFSSAEDALQEALIAAADQWPREGLPDNPRGWLIHVAGRRLTDVRRSEFARRQREQIVAIESTADRPFAPGPDEPDQSGADDTLVLLLMCAHPALTPPSAIALTLRAVGGLTTAEIARAFFVPEATMAQRISRAKQTIASSGVPFRMPEPADRRARVRAVLHVLYLIFNEGYAATTGPSVHRVDLSSEAIRLARALHRMLPTDPDVTGLLALMILTDARRPARTGPDGELIPLDDQDRSLWDRAAINEGAALVDEAARSGPAGDYLLQAAVNLKHDEAPTIEATDWRAILALYGHLREIADNPMVALNEAVAFAMVEGPRAGLCRLDALEADGRLTHHYRLDAVRAHLFERAGDRDAAGDLYRRAASRTSSAAERDYLLVKAARADAPPA